MENDLTSTGSPRNSHHNGAGKRPARLRAAGRWRRAEPRGQSLARVFAGLVLAVLVLTYLAYLQPLQETVSTTPHQAVGGKLERFPLEPLIGQTAPLQLDELSGQVVLVNFWGPWCPPCRLELPHLIELAEKFSQRNDFRLVAVSCGTSVPDDIPTLRQETLAFLEEIGKAHITVYADPNFDARRAFRAVGRFQGYPTTFVIDRRGTIRAVWEGYNPAVIRQIEQWVEQLLDEPPGALD